jgi:hypothetical protein
MELNSAASGDAQRKRSHSAKRGVVLEKTPEAQVRVMPSRGDECDVFRMNAVVTE